MKLYSDDWKYCVQSVCEPDLLPDKFSDATLPCLVVYLNDTAIAWHPDDEAWGEGFTSLQAELIAAYDLGFTQAGGHITHDRFTPTQGELALAAFYVAEHYTDLAAQQATHKDTERVLRRAAQWTDLSRLFDPDKRTDKTLEVTVRKTSDGKLLAYIIPSLSHLKLSYYVAANSMRCNCPAGARKGIECQHHMAALTYRLVRAAKEKGKTIDASIIESDDWRDDLTASPE